MTTPSIPGVDREALAAAIYDAWKDENRTTSIPRYVSADAAIAYIAAHQKRPALPSDTAPTVLRLAAADIRGMHLGFGGLPRSLPGTLEALADALEAAEATPSPTSSELEHDDEWVEVGGSVVSNLPNGARARVQHDWVVGYEAAPTTPCYLVHRDDLPDPDADLVERMARAIFASYLPDGYWGNWGEDVPEHYRTAARAALAAYREEER